jgi:uncharacterized protein (DUF3820 family)
MDLQSLPIVPFGKYKGRPITDLLNDTKYVEWCKQQEWFQKFPIVYNICVNQTITTNNPNAKTPEHNKIQNMFLENENIGKIVRATFKTGFRYKKNIDYDCARSEFEGEYNWDVIISCLSYNKVQCNCKWDEMKEGDSCECKYENDDKYEYELPKIYIEIKPLVGDDYPCILRKMKLQRGLTQDGLERMRKETLDGTGYGPDKKFNFQFTKDEKFKLDYLNRNPMAYEGRFILLIKEYNSINTPKDKLVEIFKQAGIMVIFTNELWDKTQIQLSTEQIEPLQLVKLSSMEEENKMLRQFLQKAEEKIKQLETEIMSLATKKQPKTINDYFGKK